MVRTHDMPMLDRKLLSYVTTDRKIFILDVPGSTVGRYGHIRRREFVSVTRITISQNKRRSRREMYSKSAQNGSERTN